MTIHSCNSLIIIWKAIYTSAIVNIRHYTRELSVGAIWPLLLAGGGGVHPKVVLSLAFVRWWGYVTPQGIL